MIQQPNHTDNKRAIKALLLEGKILDSMKVLRLVGTTEIRHYIASLRKEMTIKDKWVSYNGKRFKRYWVERGGEA